MDYTTNLNLKKPNGEVDGDFVLVEDLNSNFDAIDTAVGDHVADADIHVTALKQAAWDVKSTRHEFSAAVTTTWVGASAPYTQDVTVAGILADDDPIINPVYSVTNATAILEKAAWGNVGKVETTLNTITLTCFEEKPITAFNLQLLVVR